jgi:hypothetical protein
VKDQADAVAETAVRAIDHAPLPPILGGAAAQTAPGERWGVALIWFMRTMAAVWLLKGLIHWATMLGVLGVGPAFADLPMATMTTIGFFGVADLLAAVGLWLATPWGGVLWLLCAATELIAPLFGERFVTSSVVALIVDAGLIVLYFILSWLAAREA